MRKKFIYPERIVDAAISLCAEIGLENMTTRKLADYIGISEGSIFNNFASKPELMCACGDNICELLTKSLRDVREIKGSDSERCAVCWSAVFRCFRNNADSALCYRQLRCSALKNSIADSGLRAALAQKLNVSEQNSDLLTSCFFTSALELAIVSLTQPSFSAEDEKRYVSLAAQGLNSLLN